MVQVNRLLDLHLVPDGDGIGDLVNQPFVREVVPAVHAEACGYADRLRSPHELGLH